ncbi:uncharacterized protein H6S33_011482 [Morchella sextelata]|uniref:uncharacterized protein n=1 Tax=Morchella sextelata TaxID=1174677 RepID=UPI001D04F8BD|nr:uncharacterized protein H6S33_011482 [Morchella sextelata]KAH0611055.1 hypothetical protein H6S33_011482 [Morchella sextelata]
MVPRCRLQGVASVVSVTYIYDVKPFFGRHPHVETLGYHLFENFTKKTSSLCTFLLESVEAERSLHCSSGKLLLQELRPATWSSMYHDSGQGRERIQIPAVPSSLRTQITQFVVRAIPRALREPPPAQRRQPIRAAQATHPRSASNHPRSQIPTAPSSLRTQITTAPSSLRTQITE